MLITLEEYKTYFNITNDSLNGHLSTLIPYTESLIDLYLGKVVEENTYTEKYDGGVPTLFLNASPVTVLTSVIDDGITLVEGTDFVAYLEEGRLEKDLNVYASLLNNFPTFVNKKQSVTVIYTAGYTNITLPSDLKLAYLLTLKSLINQQKKPAMNIVGQSLHGENRQFAQPSTSDIHVIPKEALEILFNYKQ